MHQEKINVRGGLFAMEVICEKHTIPSFVQPVLVVSRGVNFIKHPSLGNILTNTSPTKKVQLSRQGNA